MFWNIFVAMTLVGMALIGCKKKDKDPKTIGASAKVQLDNGTASLRLDDSIALTTYGMKIVRVYVSEDINADTGANVGNTFMVYINPECGDDADTGTATCDISGADNNVEEYFDLLRTSEEVNKDLNAQDREIAIEVAADSDQTAVGTLRYARVEFSGANPDNATDLVWGTADISDREVALGGTSTTKLDEPIDVEAGDSITFSLTYDYADAVRRVENAPDGNDCLLEAGQTMKTCFFPPEFTASATKD